MKTLSPLKWIGGKTRLLPNLYKYLPDAEDVSTYYEPFMGSGALYFEYGYKAKTAVLNDICQPLMLTYSELALGSYKDIEEELFSLLESSYEEIKEEFNALKLSEVNPEAHPDTCIRFCALFIALNFLGFNGVYRENRKGEYNVPAGKDSKGNRRLLAEFNFDKLQVAANKLSENAVICCDSFDVWASKTGSNAPGKGDLVFSDSPYLKEFSQYNKDGFTVDMHRNLQAYCRTSANNGATVVICGSNNEASHAIYGQPTEVIELQRTVGHSKRGKATEALYVYTK